ncbi:MAG: tetratricopeptide repeat protein, partial [Fimbriiglobus sp.]|nr:tetratricopeptide repeat protein [Fimbriiglobus sp.]
YDKQIPPGAAAVLHYRLDIPADAKGPVELTARLRYRKFDDEYMKLVYEGKPYPTLPIIDICQDTVTLPVEGGPTVAPQESPIKPAWQRWNDYGIGNLLEGGAASKRGNFKQAEEAFRKVLTANDAEATPHGHLNLARTYIEEGRLDEAAKELEASGNCEKPAPWWSRLWFTAQVNAQNASRTQDLLAVVAELEKLLDPKGQPTDRGFDFTKDYVAWNMLANLLFKVRKAHPEGSTERREFTVRAIQAAERVIALDAEDVTSHDLLALAYGELAGEVPTVTTSSAPTAETMTKHAALAAEAKEAATARKQACDQLLADLPKLPAPKLATIREVMGKLRPAFHAEKDPSMQSVLAAVLAAYHRESHDIYKPDEVARSNATRIYREKNPAANYAAGDRVIYPTTPAHRQAIIDTGELPR